MTSQHNNTQSDYSSDDEQVKAKMIELEIQRSREREAELRMKTKMVTSVEKIMNQPSSVYCVIS